MPCTSYHQRICHLFDIRIEVRLTLFLRITSKQTLIKCFNLIETYGGGLILCINEKIPCKILNDETMSIASEIVIEFHQSKRKCLMLRIFKRLIQDETHFLQQLSLAIVFCYLRYANIIIIGYFNMTIENHHLGDFMQTLSCLITKPTCKPIKSCNL